MRAWMFQFLESGFNFCSSFSIFSFEKKFLFYFAIMILIENKNIKALQKPFLNMRGFVD